MSVAQVVLLRRFDPGHQWFDYDIPASLPVGVGQLVVVPFLRSPVQGVVWKIIDHSEHGRLRSILRISRSEPVLSTWQQKTIELVARAGATSLGHVIQRALPTYSSRATKDELLTRPNVSMPASSLPAGQTWWYQERLLACRWAASWLVQPTPRPRLILTPTEEDGQDISRTIQPDQELVFVSSTLSRTVYRRLYEGIRLGHVRWVIGTSQALLLPWPQPPEILIDQEEHSGHKQTEQHPRLDIRPVLSRLTDRLVALSPAPSVRWYVEHQPTPPKPLAQGQRLVWSLDRPQSTPWISDELRQVLDKATATHQLLLIAPQRGYASAMVCADCHQAVACPACHQRVALFSAGKLTALCHQCRTPVAISIRCPSCGGSRWQFRGLGLDRIVEQLRTFLPTPTVSTEPGAAITVQTYRAYRLIERLPALKMIVLLSGDTMRNWPDFSVDERTWQYLWRVQAAAPTIPLAVQTFLSASDFWQRWRRADHTTWYRAETDIRQRMKLPPFTQQWLALLKTEGARSRTAVRQALTQLEGLDIPGFKAEPLPERNAANKRAVHRILLTAPADLDLTASLPWQEIFPYPWQVDTSVSSWLA